MKVVQPNSLPEIVEGSEAFARFDATMKAILSVPHSELVCREREYRERSLQNPNRRGPKPKRKLKPSTSSVRAFRAKG